MLALHALWSPGEGLGFWAEDAERAVKSPSQALRIARDHPFAAPAEVVADVHSGKAGSAILLLPSLLSAPLDSPELVRVTPRPRPRTPPSLLPWSVPLTWLSPAAALAALEEPSDTVRYGASIAFLAELATFARDLVERRRVLPAVVRDGTGVAARWRPVLQGPDVVAFDALVATMPPICRAQIAAPTEASGGDPHDLAMDALATLVDVVERERFATTGGDLVPARRGRRPKNLAAAEAWLAALSTKDGRFDADAGQLDELERELSAWGEVGAGETGPGHATFRLSDGLSDVEPGPEPRWHLEFLLQSTQDPSLLVSAEQAWNEGTGLARWLDRPQELLLAELGRASRVYPALAAALDTTRPCALDLDAEGAYRFLAESASLLDDAGFGVLLPSWWNGRSRLGLSVTASSTPTDGVVRKKGRFGQDELVKFHWQLAIGDHTLTEEEIAALSEAKAPLVRVRGQWVAVDQEQLSRGLEFLRRKPKKRSTAGELLRMAATHPDDTETPLPLTAVHADGWLGDLLNGSIDQALRPMPAPEGLHAQLRPYQERGLSWLAFLAELGVGACLADDMGLGKTIQLLALECLQRTQNPDAAPTLLICPMSLVGNWQRESAKFTPGLRVYAHHGKDRLHGDALDERLADTDLIVTTYATATRDIDELAGHEWHRVVLDEAQAVKNSRSRASVAVRRLDAGQRVALTGTPLENRLAELWSIMDFVNPGMLGSPEKFRTRYAIPVERHRQTEPAQRLRTITQPYVLRRLKTDPKIIDDLPEKIEIKQYYQLTTEQASLYRAVVDDMMDKIENSDGIQRRGNVLAAMAKLKQVCNHPAQLLHDRSAVGQRSGKVIRLEEVLGEILDEGDKAICFTQFTEFAEMLLPHLSARFDRDVLYLHGGTPKKRRDEMVERFQSDSGPAIFLLSLKAGGTGLNLTAANHVLHLDRWWNPAVENQATDRAFRIGQKRNVQVRKFVCVGTLEEKIDAMIEEKKALADMVISDGEGWLTELNTGTLREMFTLSEEAVGE